MIASICTITGTSIWGIVTYINSEKEGNKYFFEVSENEEYTENIDESPTDEMVEDITENLSVDTMHNSANTNYSPNADIHSEKNIEMFNVEDEVKKLETIIIVYKSKRVNLNSIQ